MFHWSGGRDFQSRGAGRLKALHPMVVMQQRVQKREEADLRQQERMGTCRSSVAPRCFSPFESRVSMMSFGPLCDPGKESGKEARLQRHLRSLLLYSAGLDSYRDRKLGHCFKGLVCIGHITDTWTGRNKGIRLPS
ncbi:hypothetical protein CHARACLAT_005801 [Characodon lateralis]|uniref:Uncharacterized protein n=1 Tax=Characodon lateralis TaxID=208331 RepID=A0ABU7F0Z2_9TELE|nr:hypothetical protein [Characodon lateralis]